MTADQCVRNGNDLMLCTTGNDFNTVTVLTNSSKQALRESAKNILYTVVNSRAYAEENLNPGMASADRPDRCRCSGGSAVRDAGGQDPQGLQKAQGRGSQRLILGKTL